MSSKGATVDAVRREEQPIRLGVLDDLQDVGRFEQQLQPIENVAQRQLALDQTPSPKRPPSLDARWPTGT